MIFSPHTTMAGETPPPAARTKVGREATTAATNEPGREATTASGHKVPDASRNIASERARTGTAARRSAPTATPIDRGRATKARMKNANRCATTSHAPTPRIRVNATNSVIDLAVNAATGTARCTVTTSDAVTAAAAKVAQLTITGRTSVVTTFGRLDRRAATGTTKADDRTTGVSRTTAAKIDRGAVMVDMATRSHASPTRRAPPAPRNRQSTMPPRTVRSGEQKADAKVPATTRTAPIRGAMPVRRNQTTDLPARHSKNPEPGIVETKPGTNVRLVESGGIALPITSPPWTAKNTRHATNHVSDGPVATQAGDATAEEARRITTHRERLHGETVKKSSRSGHFPAQAINDVTIPLGAIARNRATGTEVTIAEAGPTTLEIASPVAAATGVRTVALRGSTARKRNPDPVTVRAPDGGALGDPPGESVVRRSSAQESPALTEEGR